MKELLVLGFLITTPLSAQASPDQAALSAASQAFYKSSGIETMVNDYVQRQLKHVPENVKIVVGNTALVVKCVSEKRITYQWTF